MVLEYAKRFASSGFWVFPLYASKTGNQKPYGWAGNKVKDDIDPSKIIPCTNLVDEVDRWPELVKAGYNSTVSGFGVMGRGVLIFDLDNKGDKQGSEKFKEFRAKFEVPRPNFVVKSKSGGYHLYYAKPKTLSNVEIKTLSSIAIAGEKFEGVDIRGDGGFVVGPTCSGPEESWEPGSYQIILGGPEEDLIELPRSVVSPFIRNTIRNDLDNLAEIAENDSDVMQILKRGEIPKSLSKGERNNGFFIFLNALKNKGFTRETAKKMALMLKAVTEEPETFDESIDLEDMISRVFQVNLNNPFDVVNDLISHGLYRLTAHKSKIYYVILEDNPYIESKNPHDLTSMKQLLDAFTRQVMVGDRPKPVNPATLIDRKITPANEATTLGYKPGEGPLFSLTTNNSGKKYLNTWVDYTRDIDPNNIDDKYWEMYKFLISRIFGEEGTEEFNLGIEFIAWILQRPGVKPSICPFIISGKRGVGKSLWLNLLQNMFGYNKLGELQARPFKVDEVSSRFYNPSGTCLMLFDEVQFSVHRDMRKESAHFWRHLKNLITSEIIPVEYKGGDTVYLPNMAGLILAGNSGNHFPIEEFDRRIWIIDNDPPELTKGLVDEFFLLVKGQLNPHISRTIINTIKYRLINHKIQMALDTMRAPMNEIKREMYLSTLSDLEEWWITHFEDHDNLLADTPVLSKSAIIFLIEVSDRLMNTKYREDPEGTFRELKRRGLFKPIRTKSNAAQSRNLLNIPIVSASGDILSNDKREVLYTSRNHGEFNQVENEVIIQAYIKNLHSIKKWREHKIMQRKSVKSQVDSMEINK